mmetsp:Transcript_15033/g.24892  ORF Transcript_15033/g.24892 Transcript_15033/m.24892 type:complete len:454 (-) Transcript_15033:309-1670(-)
MSFKRQAETDLNQDNVHEMDKEVSDKAKHDTWKRAPDSVLASRKILKVSEGFSSKTKESAPATTTPAVGGGFAAYAKINPFAAMGPPTGFSSTANKTAASFPSKSGTIPSVPAAAPPAPKVSSSPKTNPFGATNPAHNPFMNFVEENKPNVDYWQKFKEPIKVPASDSVSSSDVKVTFVNPSNTPNKPNSEASSPTSTVTSPSGSNVDSSNNGDVVKDNSCSDTTTVTDKTSEEPKATDSSNSNEEKSEASPTTSTISEKKPAIDTAAMFSKPAELDNGEAGEECVLKLRAKLYRLSDVEKSAAKEWVEVGTGPVRLLTPSASLSAGSSHTSEEPLFPRVVMRREHQAGGPGTKVILNASFRSRFSVSKMGERAARLTCLAVPPEAPKSISLDEIGATQSISATEKAKEEDDAKPKAVPMTFLFKMQHSHEADQFIKHINGFLEKSAKEDAKE